MREMLIKFETWFVPLRCIAHCLQRKVPISHRFSSFLGTCRTSRLNGSECKRLLMSHVLVLKESPSLCGPKSLLRFLPTEYCKRRQNLNYFFNESSCVMTTRRILQWTLCYPNFACFMLVHQLDSERALGRPAAAKEQEAIIERLQESPDSPS